MLKAAATWGDWTAERADWRIPRRQPAVTALERGCSLLLSEALARDRADLRYRKSAAMTS
jgi:hypothetical protein